MESFTTTTRLSFCDDDFCRRRDDIYLTCAASQPAVTMRNTEDHEDNGLGIEKIDS